MTKFIETLKEVVGECEPEFTITFGPSYIYGDHPDVGGGVECREIEDCTLEGIGDVDREGLLKIFTPEFIKDLEGEYEENYEE